MGSPQLNPIRRLIESPAPATAEAVASGGTEAYLTSSRQQRDESPFASPALKLPLLLQQPPAAVTTPLNRYDACNKAVALNHLPSVPQIYTVCP